MNIVIQKPTEIKIKDTEYFAIDFDKSGILYAIGNINIKAQSLSLIYRSGISNDI